MHLRAYILPAVTLLAMISCTELAERRRDVDNEGAACVSGEQVKVDFGTCLSSSCDTLEGASCMATLEGDTITVTSVGTVVSAGNACTNDCRFATTTCDVTGGDLTAATKISYAGQESADLACTAP